MERLVAHQLSLTPSTALALMSPPCCLSSLGLPIGFVCCGIVIIVMMTMGLTYYRPFTLPFAFRFCKNFSVGEGGGVGKRSIVPNIHDDDDDDDNDNDCFLERLAAHQLSLTSSTVLPLMSPPCCLSSLGLIS